MVSGPGHTMHDATRPPSLRPSFWHGLLTAASVALLIGSPTAAEEQGSARVRTGKVLPGGLRTSATESWGAYDLELTNLGDADRTARVLVFYTERPDEQYGRDVGVPAHASVSAWMLVGPAVGAPHAMAPAVQVQRL